MKFYLGKRSKERLIGVHPDLIKVVHWAIGSTTVDFTVLEGVRTTDRQRKLFQAGASTTLNSRHLPKISRDPAFIKLGPLGHAVDLGAWVDGEVRWDWPLYYLIADAMKMAAIEEDVSIIWGGDWKHFKDGPHYELPRQTHPV